VYYVKCFSEFLPTASRTGASTLSSRLWQASRWSACGGGFVQLVVRRGIHGVLLPVHLFVSLGRPPLSHSIVPFFFFYLWLGVRAVSSASKIPALQKVLPWTVALLILLTFTARYWTLPGGRFLEECGRVML